MASILKQHHESKMAIKNHTLSNEYTQDPHKQWFVLRATYNRQKKAYDYIVSKGEVAYMPLHYTQKIVCEIGRAHV